MSAHLARRTLSLLLLLTLVSVATFALFYALPTTDPALLRAGRQPTPELIASIRDSLHLDEPLHVQYLEYAKAVLTGDLGFSYTRDAPVLALILDRLPATVALAVGAVALWLLIAVPVGVVSALRRGRAVDRICMGAALVSVSAPVYWLGLVALYLLASDIGAIPVLPGAGSYRPLTEDPVAWAGSLMLPWLVLAAGFAGIYARFLRGRLAEVMQEDWIRAARARGLPERQVVRHGVRAAITPVVTMLGLDIGVLLGGAVLTETVFNLPGVGRLAYDAIAAGDMPVIQGTVLLGAVFIVLASFVVDGVYEGLDPRVRSD